MIAAVYPGGQGLRESRGGATQVVEGNYEGMVGKDEASPTAKVGRYPGSR